MQLKKKLSVALFSSLMFIGLTFSSVVGASPPHKDHPGYGGGSPGDPPCTSYPCPIRP